MDTLVKHNFARPFQPNSRLTKADADLVAALIGGQAEADAAAIGKLDRILAAGYETAQAPAGAFGQAVRKHGGRVTAMAVHKAYFMTGRSCPDIMEAAAAMVQEAAEQGTGHLGAPAGLDGRAVAEDPDAPVPAMAQDPPPPLMVGAHQLDFAADFKGDASALELTPQEEDALDRHRRARARPVLRWATREGLALFEGAPGRKHPLKDYYADGWAFRPWRGSGTALARIHPDLVVLDGDTDEGRSAIAAMNLPAHFAIRSLETGGEKHFFRFQDPPRRMIRALPGLDFLANPGNKFCWCKIDNGDGGYEIISESEDCPDLPDEVVAALAEAKASGAIIANSGIRAGRTRQAAPGVRWDDDDELLPTGHYAEHGIPYGLQEDRFYRLADRFAAQGVTEAEGTRQLLAIARECEQDDRNPWTGDQLKEKMTRAIAWVATLPARKVPGKDEGGSSARVLPSPRAPMRVARQIADEDLATPQGLPSLRWHRGGFARWDGTAWPAEEGKAVEDAVRKQLYEITEHAMVKTVDADGKIRFSPWNPNPKKIADLLEALGVAVLQLPHRLEPPFWITSGGEERGLIPMANGLLDFRTRELTPHTPDFFNAWSLPYDYDPDAPEPAEWLRFLGQLWPDEPESIDYLQELAGYLVSGDTSQEKITLMIGAKRGGKGTVCKVLTALLGEQNVASPTFASLTERFGLAPLIGKPLAVISDARVGGRDIQAAAEKLLTISGRDRLSVDRKYKRMWEGQLPTRLIIVSNELFALRDASTALVSRCIPLIYAKSWLNREDTGLGARLTIPRELSRILPWALAGLDRLRKQGKFTMPAGAAETLAALERLASPEKAWAEEHCEFGPGFWERTEYLHGAFELWASNEQRMKNIPNREVFAKNLRAAFPELVYTRPRSEEDGKQYPGYRGIRLLRPAVAAQEGAGAPPAA